VFKHILGRLICAIFSEVSDLKGLQRAHGYWHLPEHLEQMLADIKRITLHGRRQFCLSARQHIGALYTRNAVRLRQREILKFLFPLPNRPELNSINYKV